MNFRKQIFAMARQDVKTLVFPEANFSDRVMSAVKIITRKQLAKVILIGDQSALFGKYSSLESNNLKIVNPQTSELTREVAEKIFELRKHKGITKEDAKVLAMDPYYFATALIATDYADGMVSGSESIASKTYLPALEMIKGKVDGEKMSSAVIFWGKNAGTRNRPIMVSDCALMQNPSKDELVENAKKCVDLWKTLFFEEPRVAFLSHSTAGSASGEEVDKMREAAKEFKEKHPDVISGGEMQLDVALLRGAQERKCPDSEIRGDANILIVPNIDAGNLLGKALGVVGGLSTVGPIGLGFKRPISDISRQASVDEIVMISALTAVQAQVD